MTDYTVAHIDPKKLQPHPANADIYGDTDNLDSEFLDSLQGGILEPLLATGELTLISGHRRRAGALLLGQSTVPVVLRPDLIDPLDIERALINANKQRTKTTEQKAREYQRLTVIEEKLASKRRGRPKSGTPTTAKNSVAKGHTLNAGKTGKGRAKAIAAKAAGLSTRTAKKASEVVDAIDAAKAAGDDDKAKDLADKLNKNVTAAHRSVAQKPPPGTDIPESLSETFENVSRFNSIVAKLGSIRSEILDLALEKGGERILIQNVRVEVKNLLEVLHAAKPHVPCPYCKGDQCAECDQYGWMTKDRYSGIPAERR